ncbi:MAG: MaoC/PaaZ C-terminal domain-containing protein [Chloroflexi bacterium]|nr:MaoC/PaaZ C-terminal domain-containing protein [Chloroflexota bacterium]MCZ6891992.1 MaoC/PaaZ C-terminal domain-containing protein [Chloroflexota bacterium]
MAATPYFEEISEGTELPELTKEIRPVNMMMYGAATWDFMRIHYDADHARERGFEGAIVDGQMEGAFLAQMVIDWAGDPGALRRLGVRYRNFIYPGDTLVCKGTVQRKFIEEPDALVECELVVENTTRQEVAGLGTAIVALPRRSA